MLIAGSAIAKLAIAADDTTPISGAGAGLQALQMEQGHGRSGRTVWDLYTGVFEHPADLEPMPHEGVAATAQTLQEGTSTGQVQRVISGTTASTQLHQPTQAEGFYEDEAELLALLIALAA